MHKPVIGVVLLLLANTAWAADAPRYEAAAAWVKPLEIPKLPVKDDGAATRILFEDVQDKFGPDGLDSYWERAERIQTAQGLASIGNFAFDWNPDTETLIIHRVHIVREGKVIDLLAGGQKFIILRRENRLEYAMLDGSLTAAFLPEGLQVGDILDVAVTYQSRDPILKGNSQRIAAIPHAPTDHFVIREIWPKDKTPHWRLTPGMAEPKVSTNGEEKELVIDMANAVRPKAPKLAPGRFSRPGRFEISEAADWAAVSALMAPLYDKPSHFKPDSPLGAEIAAIKAASSEPKARAAAALRLVQDQVRYLFLGMNNGGFIPADADATWLRRFGDCKGKTVLLLALLRELGIEAEPALVDTEHGDDLDVRTPMAASFNHVIVRATIGGKVYWLDGTRSGDRNLDELAIPDFQWALPLRVAGASLEKIFAPPLEKPEVLMDLHLDASAGIDIPAPAEAHMILRGDEATRYKERLAAMSADDVASYLRDYWHKEYDFIDVNKVEAAYDDATGEERLTMQGTAKMEWKRRAGKPGRRYETDGAVLGWKADYEREPGPNRDAPFTVTYPYFEKKTETIVLPNAGHGFTVEGDAVDTVIGGYELKRTFSLENGVFTMSAGTRAVAPEFPAVDAPAVQKSLRDMFDQTVYLRSPARYKITDQELAALPPPKTADEFVDRGFQYDLRDDYKHAIADYDSAIALDPNDSLAYGNRGSDHFFSGNYGQAAADFDKALQIDPREAVAVRGRGLILAHDGHYKEAVETFNRSLDIEPERLFAIEQRGRAYFGLLDFAAAQADTETVLRRDPNRMDMHRLLVDILYNRRDGDGLIAEADKIADLKDDALAHVTRGYGLLFKAKLPEARGEFDAAIAAKPSVPAYIARAVTHEKTQLDEALKDFDAAFKLQPDAQQVYLARASAYLAAGKDDLAIKDIDVLLKKAPDDAHLIKMRSYALVHDHKYAQAIGEMDKLLDKTPHDSVLLNDRCWYRAMWGKELEAALSDCDQSIKEKSSAASLDSRGLVYLRLGRFGDAVADYTEALKARPSQSTSLYGRGLAKLRNGATEAGLVDLKAARAVDEKIDAQFADFGLQP